VRTSPRALVLLYHRIALEPDPWGLGVSPEHFTEHLEVLRTGWRPTSLCALAQALAAGSIVDRAVAVTFDDGYADNLSAGVPALESAGVPATFFLITGAIGRPRFWSDELDRLILWPGRLPDALELEIGATMHRWTLGNAAVQTAEDRAQHGGWGALEPPATARHDLYRSLYGLLQPLGEAEREEAMATLRAVSVPDCSAAFAIHRPMTTAEVRKLADSSAAEIGSHTITHPVLARLSVHDQEVELRESRRALALLTGHAPASCSFPYGGREHYTAETPALARRAGYRCACAAFPGVVSPMTDMFQLPRVAVVDEDGDALDRRLRMILDAGT
jgi:peptidoglycan/xylan/chitin deacetylase (PgdA/CDA1 family)